MSDIERKRASLFGDPTPEVGAKAPHTQGLNLDRFAPKPAPPINAKTVEKISEEVGFTAKHSRSVQKPAQKRDGRTLKKSPRTTQFNVRLKPETTEKFWAGTEKEGMAFADDFLAHLLELYEVRGVSGW